MFLIQGFWNRGKFGGEEGVMRCQWFGLNGENGRGGRKGRKGGGGGGVFVFVSMRGLPVGWVLCIRWVALLFWGLGGFVTIGLLIFLQQTD